MFMMFKKYNINPELSKYMKEENNKWSKRYSTKSIYQNDIGGQYVNNLVKYKKNNFNNSSFFLYNLNIFYNIFCSKI